MATDDRTCPSCGARVSPDTDRCDLCGTAIESSSERGTDSSSEGEPVRDASSPSEEISEEKDQPDEESHETQSVFCNQCGWENPQDANYCSQCGEELQDVAKATLSGTRPVAADLPTGAAQESKTASAPEHATSEQTAVGRQIALVVGGAVVLVVALFFVTQWSEGYDWSEEPADEPSAAQTPAGTDAPMTGGSTPSAGQMPGGQSGGGTASPTDLQELVDQAGGELSGPIASQVDSLRGLIDDAPAGEEQQLKAKLVNLLIGAGQPGQAAVLQKGIADASGAVEDRRRAADLLYRWMQRLQEEGEQEQVVEVAKHAAQAYASVAEEQPEDLDARTRMGETYLLTNEPMKGIRAINAVLEDDSTFVPARFQKGLALLQINRIDQARQQFEKVRRDAEDNSPFYQQANRAIQVIDERGTASDGESSAGAGTRE